jgi:hypothetical protein
MRCSSVAVHWRFEGWYRLHLQSFKIKPNRKPANRALLSTAFMSLSCMAYRAILKTQAINFSETSPDLYRTTELTQLPPLADPGFPTPLAPLGSLTLPEVSQMATTRRWDAFVVRTGFRGGRGAVRHVNVLQGIVGLTKRWTTVCDVSYLIRVTWLHSR